MSPPLAPCVDQRSRCRARFTYWTPGIFVSITNTTLRPQMSFLEIYNEQIFDLLQPEGLACPPQQHFTTYGGSGNGAGSAGAKTQWQMRSSSTLKIGDALTAGVQTSQHTEPTRASSSHLQGDRSRAASDLAIYEQSDGSTYAKVDRSNSSHFGGDFKLEVSMPCISRCRRSKSEISLYMNIITAH